VSAPRIDLTLAMTVSALTLSVDSGRAAPVGKFRGSPGTWALTDQPDRVDRRAERINASDARECVRWLAAQGSDRAPTNQLHGAGFILR
jgi:hypothetical protein